MKKYITSVLLLTLITGCSYSQSGWFWQNPLPQGNTLYDVEFIGNGIAIACGLAGTILRTTNSGATWNVINNDSGVFSKSIDFFNSNTGWMISTYNGAARFKKTTDGGFIWNEIAVVGGADASNIEFVSLDTGYASVRGSTGSYVYKTTNSGNNWNSVFYYSGSYVYSTYFINNSTGFVCGSFGISKTTNGGINWVNKYGFSGPSQYSAKNIHFIDDNTGIAVGQYSVILGPSFGRTLKTTNAGENWVVVYEGINNSRFEDLDFVNNTTGFICGSGLSKSTNIGSNWLSIQSSNFNLLSNDILLSNGLIVGELGIILQTTNSGENWINNFVSNRSYSDVSDIQFYKNIGYASSSDNVLKTTNAGLNWISYDTQSPTQLLCLSVIDSNIVFAGGGNTAINCPVVKTTNGGINWVLQNPNVGNGYLYDIFFIDLNTGYCSGTGVVSKTTNGGAVWVPTNIPGAGPLNSIFFVNGNTGYVVGFYNSYKTTNGGLNWNLLQVSGQSGYFINAMTGFVAGLGMRIKKTIDGGSTWITQTQSSESWRFYSIQFINSNSGIAVGEQGTIAVTTNSGSNWYYQKSPTNYTLFSGFMRDTNEAYIAGRYGTILKTTNNGFIIGLNNNSQNTPNNFSLFQNYPNPFNPLTKIKFDVPKESFTKLVIYDLLGREVATLVNEELSPGTYEADWDASSFSSGVYFYKIISGDFVETKKMVLMK